ncbi:MAG: hypothetical protein NHB14_18220 [Desulfosporosinus sp.]|nr:hypothetical protein [Desulfosporosinus sp.]
MKRINSLHKSTLISIIGVFLLVASSMPARADNLQQQLNQSQQQANQLNGVLKAQKKKLPAQRHRLWP